MCHVQAQLLAFAMPRSKKVSAYFRSVENHLTDFRLWLRTDNLMLQGGSYTGICDLHGRRLLYFIDFLFTYMCASLLKAKVMAGKERRADLVV